jgi:hypothetical protein
MQLSIYNSTRYEYFKHDISSIITSKNNQFKALSKNLNPNMYLCVCVCMYVCMYVYSLNFITMAECKLGFTYSSMYFLFHTCNLMSTISNFILHTISYP